MADTIFTYKSRIPTYGGGQRIPYFIPQSPLLNGLIAYYNMETDANDVTGNGYNLILKGGATSSASIYKGGSKSMAFTIGSTTDGAQGLYSSTTAPIQNTESTSAFTIGGWYYLDELPTTNRYPVIFSIQSNTGRIITAYYNNESGTRYFRFDFYTGTLYITRYNPGALATNTWHHFMYRQEGDGTFEFYHNNTKVVDTTRNENGNAGWTKYFRIGADNGSSTQGWLGYVDDVGYWNRALTTAEITELYNSGAGKFYPFS